MFMGAASVLSNGTVMSRAGSASVAMLASAQRLPVLVCCETYKFHERVQLDSITQNELGNPDDLVAVSLKPEITSLADWRSQPYLGEPILSFSRDALVCARSVAAVLRSRNAMHNCCAQGEGRSVFSLLQASGSKFANHASAIQEGPLHQACT